jgi:cobalt-zinc-cadmium resistance protein CzcA
MFRPMAITVCSALFGSLLLALFVVPVLSTFALKPETSSRGAAVGEPSIINRHAESPWFENLRERYRTTLVFTMRHRRPAIALALLLVAVAVASLTRIGTEFMPRLDEGSVLVQTRKLPGISLTDSIALSRETEKVLLQLPEVRSVVTKLGRPDLATEAMGINQGDVYVLLKPREQWKNVTTKDELIEKLSEALNRIPGVSYNFTQPMAMRLDEVVSGIKADVALKIFGEDARVLEQKAEQALRLVSTVPGAADAQMEIVSGVAELRIAVDRRELARYGLNVSDVRAVVETAVRGRVAGEIIEGQKRFALVMRLPEQYRRDPEAVRELLIPAPAGEKVRLGQVAMVESARGPEVISREGGQRRIVVQANVRGRDLGSFVEDAQAKVASSLQLPPGYSIEWGGQFENQERATKRLAIVLPAVIFIIFGLLFASFNSAPQALLILFNVPFALVGGVAALWLRGMNLNLSASVGFIALFGVAVLNGIVMVSYINRLRGFGHDVRTAVIEGASARLRPVLMTALVASLGFLPMAVAISAGAEVQRPLATVVIGGLVTSTVLTLLVLPVVYPWFSRDVMHADPAG